MKFVAITNRAVITSLGSNIQENIRAISEKRCCAKRLTYDFLDDNFPVKIVGDLSWRHAFNSADDFLYNFVFDQLLSDLRIKQPLEVDCAIINIHQTPSFEFSRIIKLFSKGSLSFDQLVEKLNFEKRFVNNLQKHGFKIEMQNMAFINNTCISGLSLINQAKQKVLHRQFKRCLIVSIDLTDLFSLIVLNTLGALATDYSSLEQAQRPFDEARGGFIKSDGAAAAIVEFESLDESKSRNIDPIAILGYSQNNDSYRLTDGQPEGEYIRRAMLKALSISNISPNDIAFVKSHGTGTRLNDEQEGRAIQTAFKGTIDKVLVTSIKGSLGHVTDASGLVEALITGEAFLSGKILPTINCDNPILDLNIVKETQNTIKKYFLLNAVGFGGNNSSLVLAHPI